MIGGILDLAMVRNGYVRVPSKESLASDACEDNEGPLLP